METRATTQAQLGYPEGWFGVGLAGALAPGEVRALRFMGRDLVLFRTTSGVASCFSAHCPHMGAHLGRGGTVVGESLRCPFHGFRFAVDGRCVATATDCPPPPTAKAERWPLCERNGFLLLYFSPDGALPDWEVPELDAAGWTPLLSRRWSLRGHPQETTENSVDVAHFRALHGYDAVTMRGNLHVDGPYLNARYTVTRNGRAFGIGPRSVSVDFDVHVHGLGYSFVEVSVPAQGIRTRHFVLPTPTDPEHIDLTVAMSAAPVERPARIHPLFALIPAPILTKLVARMVFRAYVQDVQADFEIWRHKIYVPNPKLARDDGPIAAYRRWARTQYGRAVRPLPNAQSAADH